MADLIKTTQVAAQVESDPSPIVKVTQVAAQTETAPPPIMRVYQICAQVEYIGSDSFRVYQCLAQFGAKPHYDTTEILPDRDGLRAGTWGVHGASELSTDYHEAINSVDTNQDGIADDWPAGPTFFPEYVYLTNPAIGNYIDFHLRAGNGATALSDHQLFVASQTISSTGAVTYTVALYQGNPATVGTAIFTYTGAPCGTGGSYPNTPVVTTCGEGTILDIPEGHTKSISDYEDLWVRITISAAATGQVSFGRICLRYPGTSRAEGPGYTSFWLSGVDLTGNILAESLRITKDLQNRSTMEVKLVDVPGTKHILPGEVVYFYWQDRCLFGGRIETVDEEYPEGHYDDYLIIHLRCVDWTRILDRFTVADSWIDTTLDEIVRQIFEDDATGLMEEGITLGEIPSFSFDKVNARREKVSDLLRELCDLAGYSWSIHPATRVLTIREKSGYAAPWTIGDGYTDYRGLRFSRSLDQYRNVQWLVGGKCETSTRTEYFHGHPSTDQTTRPRTFTVSYPISREPTISIKLSGEGAFTAIPSNRIGIKGIDTDETGVIAANPTGWKKWFWSKDDPEISQQSDDDGTANPTLTTEDTIKVEYIGLFPLIGYEESLSGIAERSAAEGGSGRYENVEEDEKTDTLDLAEDRCNRLLAQFGRVPATLKYQIDRDGLEPGMIQPITISGHGVNADYLIEELTITFPKVDLSMLRCDVQSLDGERQEGWVDFWRKSQQAGRKFSLRENEIVANVHTETDTVDIADTITDSVNGSVIIPEETSDPYSIGMYGTVTVDSVEYDLWRYGWSRYGEEITV